MKDKEWTFTRVDLPFLFYSDIRKALLTVSPTKLALDVRSLLTVPVNTISTEEDFVGFMTNHGGIQ